MSGTATRFLLTKNCLAKNIHGAEEALRNAALETVCGWLVSDHSLSTHPIHHYSPLGPPPVYVSSVFASFFFFFGHVATCVSLFPRPGIEPTPLAMEAWSQPLDHQGSPCLCLFVSAIPPYFRLIISHMDYLLQ